MAISEDQLKASLKMLKQEMLETKASSSHSEVVKLPEFWTDNPDSWFKVVESQFVIKNVKDESTNITML